MSLITCYNRMKEHLAESGLADKIPVSRLRQIAAQLEAAGADALDREDFRKKATDVIENDQQRWTAAAKAERTAMIYTRENAVKSILANVKDWTENRKGLLDLKAAKDMPREAMRVWEEGGSLRAGDTSNRSPQTLKTQNMARYLKTFTNVLRQTDGLREAAAAGNIDRPALQELDAIDRGQELGKSGNPMALEYAKAIKVLRDEIFKDKQAYTPWLEKAKDYLVKQFHAPERVEAAGKDAWTARAMEVYGEKSFPEMDAAQKQEAFSYIYDRIVDRSWGTVKSDAAMDRFANVDGIGGSIARRMGQSRSLIASDWEAAADYNAEFGPKTIYDGLNQVMNSASRDVATLQKFGSNPDVMQQQVYQKVLGSLTGEQAEAFGSKDTKKYLEKTFDAATGARSGAANGKQAKLVEGVIKWQYLAHGAMGFLRGFPDLAGTAGLFRSLEGRNYFSNIQSLVSNYVQGMRPFGGADFAQAGLQRAGIFFNALHTELAQDLGAPDSKPGVMSGLVEKAGSLTLYNRHVQAVQNAIGSVLSARMGEMSGTAHADLPASWQKGLGRYGIDAKSWDLMRLGTENVGGKTMLTPEGIRSLPDVVAENYLRNKGLFKGQNTPPPRMLDYARLEMSSQLGSMVNEHATLGSAHGDLRQKNFLLGDTTINTPEGQFWRLINQFRTAAVASNDIYRRNFLSGDGPKGDYAGVVQHMLLAGTAWTAGNMIAQQLSGKGIENLLEPKNIIKALAGSGVAGIYGDMVLGMAEENREAGMAGRLQSGILGPSIGTVSQLAAPTLQGGMEAAGIKAPTNGKAGRVMNVALSNVPLQNLFYGKGTFNYYIANGLREWAKPGYLVKTGQTSAW